MAHRLLTKWLVLMFGTALPAVAADPTDLHGKRAMVDRFDAIIVPAVTNAVRKPITDQGGELAWGHSYAMSALVDMLEATRDPRYAALFVQLADWAAKSRDDQQGLRDAVRDRLVPAWGSTNYSKGIRYTWAVHTGMIAAPIARFAAVVRNDPALKKGWNDAADRLLRIAEAAVAVHDPDYREGPAADEGYVESPYLKKPLPLNMQNALARAWLAIDDATQTSNHRDRVSRLARFMKNRLRSTDDGAYVWAYWPPLTGTNDTFEDISHAAINVDFMVLCCEHGIVFTPDDLARLEKTLLKRVVLADNRISDTVGGGPKFNQYASGTMRWARLGRHFPAVHDRLVQLSRVPAIEQDHTALAVGLALLSLPSADQTTSQPKSKP